MSVIAAPPRMTDFMAFALRQTLAYAERILKDIPADRFAHMPIPRMNHPAFCIGHLSLYPNRLLNMIGRKDLVREKPGYAELFQAGVECVEQDGRYPAKDELVTYYFDRYRTISELLPTTTTWCIWARSARGGVLRALAPRSKCVPARAMIGSDRR